MHIPSSQFPPLFDRDRFPILAGGGDEPTGPLAGCDSVHFCCAADDEKAAAALKQPGRAWHDYGDVRWPWEEVWLEFSAQPGGYPSACGVLIKRCPLPMEPADKFEWAASNGPLAQLFVDARGEQEKSQAIAMWQTASATTDDGVSPEDEVPAHVQCYCLYRQEKDGTAALEARYTDLLNEAGQIIPRYRTMLGSATGLDFRRFLLHGVCMLNIARRSGMDFLSVSQLPVFAPVLLADGDKGPEWATHHPMRIFRPRPAIRALPVDGALVHGALSLEAMERAVEAHRTERNRHMLAFARVARPHASVHAEMNDVLAAYVHKCHGAAIYSLPDALTEEFLHTGCDEVNLHDIRLPFQSLYISFRPPKELKLGDALVDGCYVCRQPGEEPESMGELLLVLTSRRADVDYGRSLSVCCTDPTFSIHLPIGESGHGCDVGVAVERGFQDFMDRNAPPTDDFSQDVALPNGFVVKHLDVRAQSRARRVETFLSQESVFHTCLNIIINALCFISFRPEDISEEWDRDPPAWVVEALADARDTRSARDRRFNANRLIVTNDYTRILVCGKRLFSGGESVSAGGAGTAARAHWRRGHWRRQRHGPGRLQVVVRWIRPTLVNQDNGQVAEARIYDVQHPS